MCKFVTEYVQIINKLNTILINQKTMKKLLFTLLLAAAVLPGWAEDLYIVGNVTTLDAYVWGSNRAPWKLEETGSGTNIYKWTGFLKRRLQDLYWSGDLGCLSPQERKSKRKL